MWATISPPASRKRKRKRWAKSTVHAPLSKKPQTDGRPALGPQRAPGDPTRAVRCRPQDAMDGPMRRLPVATCTRESHPGPPRSLSPLLAHRKPRGESRSRLPTPPTGTPREEEDAGSGGGFKRQGAVICLPISHFPSSTTAFNLPGRVNKNKRKNCCVAIQSVPPLPAA